MINEYNIHNQLKGKMIGNEYSVKKKQGKHFMPKYQGM